MYLKDVSHVGLSLCCWMCHSLNNNKVLQLPLHLVTTALQPLFCWARRNAQPGPGDGAGTGNSSSNISGFVPVGKLTPGTTLGSGSQSSTTPHVENPILHFLSLSLLRLLWLWKGQLSPCSHPDGFPRLDKPLQSASFVCFPIRCSSFKAITVSLACLAFTFLLMLILPDIFFRQLLDRTIIPLNCYQKCHLFPFVNSSASKLLTLQSTNVVSTAHFTAE